MNALEPGVIRKIHASKMPFKQMENISQFMQVRGSTIIIFSISVSVATYIYTAKRNHPHRDLTPSHLDTPLTPSHPDTPLTPSHPNVTFL